MHAYHFKIIYFKKIFKYKIIKILIILTGSQKAHSEDLLSMQNALTPVEGKGRGRIGQDRKPSYRADLTHLS